MVEATESTDRIVPGHSQGCTRYEALFLEMSVGLRQAPNTAFFGCNGSPVFAVLFRLVLKMARPKRFELLTPRFVVRNGHFAPLFQAAN